MKEAFCMYCDHNYLPQAMVTLRTLHQHDPDIKVFVLALSRDCENILKDVQLPNLQGVIPLPELELSYPELAAIKLERRTLEYYFTLTPFLPHYLFRVTNCERITYIDADLCFYSSTLSLRNSLASATIAIVPHRFSPSYEHARIFGHYNVAWITFTRTPEGMSCLDRYKGECAAWCYDRFEGDWFADQKYLDRWPERYPNLHVIQHKGANLAIWNADNYDICETDSGVMIDDEPLVFYHFSGTKIDRGGILNIDLPRRHAKRDSVFANRVVKPYAGALLRERSRLLQRFPALRALQNDLRAPTHGGESLASASEPPSSMSGRANDPFESPVCCAGVELSICLDRGDTTYLLGMLDASNADQAERFHRLEILTGMLESSAVESADRLKQIQSLTALLQRSEAEVVARQEVIQGLEKARAALYHEIRRLIRDPTHPKVASNQGALDILNWARRILHSPIVRLCAKLMIRS